MRVSLQRFLDYVADDTLREAKLGAEGRQRWQRQKKNIGQVQRCICTVNQEQGEVREGDVFGCRVYRVASHTTTVSS